MSDEWAKTVGKGCDLVRELGKFLAPFIKLPLENASGMVSDKLAYMRWERQVRFMVKSKEFMRKQGLETPTRAVPLNVAIPLMQAASMEENDALQDTWARLLVNASDADSGVEVRRSFINILEQLTPFEADILGTLYTIDQKNPGRIYFTYGLPEFFLVYENNASTPKPDNKDVQLALWNLIRLGCIVDKAFASGNAIAIVGITTLGVALVQACTLKPKG